MRSGLLLGVAAMLAAGSAFAQAPAPLRLELNRLEPVEEGRSCRVYLVSVNRADAAVDSLKLDLVLFGTDGVINRRLALELGPLPPAKTSVRLFDLPGLACDGVGSLLLNDVLACGSGVEAGTCLGRIELASRTPAGFAK